MRLLVLFLIHSISLSLSEDESGEQDIKDTWLDKFLNVCHDPERYFSYGDLSCIQYWTGSDVVQVEIRSLAPLLLRFPKFASSQTTENLRKVVKTGELEEMSIAYDDSENAGKVRKADGVWLSHDEKTTHDYFKKLGRVLTFDPETSEKFLLLKYDKFGHYAPHFDFLDEDEKPEFWNKEFGNRLATLLLIAQTADEGGGTVFPLMQVTVQPEEGDLIFWLNADSKDTREDYSGHGACPIMAGTKVALSLWIHSFHHKDLTSPLESEDPSYRLDQILRM
ncbi:hypothetical protein L596_013774 [Steinernema carpocapsae]|uniref:Fe2OG dioxygenase domain-containing protein n=1 Tax=Steinernema carpocapsae TaxID=34508 RepID=A0A4U5P2A6_STECR|nr:hypothetical protein L596_013774 [Steinernema carpocapsae]